MRKINFTPEELATAHDRNEHFHGRRANMDKIRFYQAIKHDLAEFVKLCQDAELVDGFDPNVHEKHSILWLDLSPAAILSKEEMAALAAIMTKVDGTVISAVDGHVRITFDIKNIWENQEGNIDDYSD